MLTLNASEKIKVLRARRVAITWHGNQKYNNQPYYYHLDQTANFARIIYRPGNLSEVHYLQTAYLHDTIEDTGKSKEDLENFFGPLVAQAVMHLTHLKKDSYQDYILDIKANNESIRLIKIADSLSNLMNSISTKQDKKVQKYLTNLNLLL